MDSVLKQSMALAASQGKCHMVAAGDWNMEESAVTSVMHGRPAAEQWWSTGKRQAFIRSTCESWQMEVAHDKQHTAVVAQLQPNAQPVSSTPTWDNLRECIAHRIAGGCTVPRTCGQAGGGGTPCRRSHGGGVGPAK